MIKSFGALTFLLFLCFYSLKADDSGERKFVFQLGHKAEINSFDISKNGRYIVSADESGKVHLFDLFSRRELNNSIAAQFQKSISKVVFSEDHSKALIVVSEEGMIISLDLEHHKTIGIVRALSGSAMINQVDILPNGEELILIKTNGQCERRSIRKGLVKQEYYGVSGGDIVDVDDNSMFLYTIGHNKLKIIDLESGAIAYEKDEVLIKQNELFLYEKTSVKGVSGLLFVTESKKGKTIFTLFDENSKEISVVYEGDLKTIRAKLYENVICLDQEDKSVVLIDLNTLLEIKRVQRPEQLADNARFVPTINGFVSTQGNKILATFDGQQEFELGRSNDFILTGFQYSTRENALFLIEKKDENYGIEVFALNAFERNSQFIETGRLMESSLFDDHILLFTQEVQQGFQLCEWKKGDNDYKVLFTSPTEIKIDVRNSFVYILEIGHNKLTQVDLKTRVQKIISSNCEIPGGISILDFVYSEKEQVLFYSWVSQNTTQNIYFNTFPYDFGLRAVIFEKKQVRDMQFGGGNSTVGHSGTINQLELNDDETILMSGGDNQIGIADFSSITHALWNTKTFEFMSKLENKTGRCLDLVNSGDFLFSGGYGFGEIARWNIHDQKIDKRFKSLTADVKQMEFISDKDLLVFLTEDGLLTFWFTSEDDLRLRLFIADEENFLFFDNRENYSGTKTAIKDVCVLRSGIILPFDRAGDSENNPGNILAYFLGNDNCRVTSLNNISKKLSKHEIKESCERDEDLKVEIKGFNPVTINSAVQLIFNGSNTADLELSISHNGVPVHPEILQVENGFSVDIQLINGLNTINYEVRRGNSIVLAEELKTTKKTSVESNIYALVAGVGAYSNSNFDLKFATKDATDFSQLLRHSYGDRLKQVKILLNEQFTVENVQAFRQEIIQAQPDDILIVYYAGHGVLDHEYNYYLGTSLMDFTNPGATGMNYLELEKIMLDVPMIHKLMFIDACHSGSLIGLEVDDTEVAQEVETEEDISFRSVGSNSFQTRNDCSLNAQFLLDHFFQRQSSFHGATVIASAGGGEFALESGEWNNGVFTFTLLQGIKNRKADLNRDHKITVAELQKYCAAEVIRLTKGKQQPTCREENFRDDFTLLSF